MDLVEIGETFVTASRWPRGKNCWRHGWAVYRRVEVEPGCSATKRFTQVSDICGSQAEAEEAKRRIG